MRIEAHLAAGCWGGGGALPDAVYAPGAPALEVEALQQDRAGHVALGDLPEGELGNGRLQAEWTEEVPPPGGSDLVGNLKSGEVAALDAPIEAGVRERAPGRASCGVGAVVRPRGYPRLETRGAPLTGVPIRETVRDVCLPSMPIEGIIVMDSNGYARGRGLGEAAQRASR